MYLTHSRQFCNSRQQKEKKKVEMLPISMRHIVFASQFLCIAANCFYFQPVKSQISPSYLQRDLRISEKWKEDALRNRGCSTRRGIPRGISMLELTRQREAVQRPGNTGRRERISVFGLPRKTNQFWPRCLGYRKGYISWKKSRCGGWRMSRAERTWKTQIIQRIQN